MKKNKIVRIKGGTQLGAIQVLYLNIDLEEAKERFLKDYPRIIETEEIYFNDELIVSEYAITGK